MKQKFKIFLTTILSLVLLVSITGCKSNTSSGDDDISYTAKMLVPSGAPVLAFVSQYQDIIKDGTFDIVDGSDQLTAQLTKANSDYDLIVAPVNLGAKLIANDQTDFKMAAIITWGNLYVVGTKDSLSGDGNIALFGESAVPQKVYDQANIETSLTPEYYSSANEVAQQLLAGNVQAGLLAEPVATATIAKAKTSGIDLDYLVDLQSSYGEDGYPQAAIFIKDGENFTDLFENMNTFTNDSYSGLEDYLNEIGTDTLSLPSVDVEVASIDRQNVRYVAASDATDQLSDFLKLFNIDFSKDMIAND